MHEMILLNIPLFSEMIKTRFILENKREIHIYDFYIQYTYNTHLTINY